MFGNNQDQNSEDVTGREPVAGSQGQGTKEEPYDRGNEESTNTGNEKSSIQPSEQKDFGNQPDTSASTRDGPSEAQSGPETGDPSSGADTTDHYQGGGKPHHEPDSENKDFKKDVPHSDEDREKAMEKGEFPHDPNDHSGEPLHMHGGDGKEAKDEEGEDNKDGDGKYDRKNSVGQEGGDPHGEKKGTGEQYVKSSGMAAEGGDFDASNPGAGKEATRLMEQKGMHKSAGNTGPPETAEGDDGSADTGKVSMMDKIKSKVGKKNADDV